jgi:hypothetical protein
VLDYIVQMKMNWRSWKGSLLILKFSTQGQSNGHVHLSQ